MTKKRIGVIGLGQWGPNHLRSFFFHPGATVVRICDKDSKRLVANQTLYPGIEGTTDYTEITRASDIDAVVVTTPVSTHYVLAKDALENGKDVLCEKPLAPTSVEASRLEAIARKNKRILMVGHVFLFNAGILELKRILQSGELGKTYYLHAERTNLGPVRNDTNAVYDLASHDISIFNYLLDAEPQVLSATGKSFLQKSHEDVAFITLGYPNGVLAHIHVSWLDPKKVRRITIVGDKKMASWDDLALAGPVEIYSKRVEMGSPYQDFGDFHLLVKEGEVLIPHVKNTEPLKAQANHFIECIEKRKQPIADAKGAVSIVRTLEAINRKLKK